MKNLTLSYRGINLFSYTVEGLENILKELDKEIKLNRDLLKLYEGIDKEDIKLNNRFRELIKSYEEDKKQIKKAINKNNDYRAIKIQPMYSYDKKEVRIIFPSDWSNKTIKKWLEENHYPVKNHNFRSYSDYDCSHRLHAVYFELKNQVAKIEYLDD